MTEPELPENLAEPTGENAPDKDVGKGIDWLGELRGLVLMLLAVVAFHSFVAKPFYIPSISMMPNLLVGDRLIVSKYPYGWSWVSASFHVLPRSLRRVLPGTPEYGDVVIVVPPDKDVDYIKRVVALPGDRIKVVNGQIVLNGKPVPQSVEPPVEIPADDSLNCEGAPCYDAFAAYRTKTSDGRAIYALPTFRETLPNGATYLIVDHENQRLDNTPEVTVPEGHVFLMGDNRDHSADSREQSGPVWQGLGGPVPLADVGGRAEFITFSLDGSETLNPLTWWGALRKGRAWHTLRPAMQPEKP